MPHSNRLTRQSEEKEEEAAAAAASAAVVVAELSDPGSDSGDWRLELDNFQHQTPGLELDVMLEPMLHNLATAPRNSSSFAACTKTNQHLGQ